MMRERKRERERQRERERERETDRQTDRQTHGHFGYTYGVGSGVLGLTEAVSSAEDVLLQGKKDR